mgnify:CR=1 FL=1
MTNTNWITDRILKQEDALLDAAKNIHDGIEMPVEQPSPPPSIDPDAERQAFADLLAALIETDDGDSDTLVTILTAEEFAEEDFVPEHTEEPLP